MGTLTFEKYFTSGYSDNRISILIPNFEVYALYGHVHAGARYIVACDFAACCNVARLCVRALKG